MDLIVACNRGCAIGRHGDLLYSLPEDMKYFRRITAGKTVFMGERTFRSLPGMQPLKGRTNIVLSDDPNFAPAGVTVVHSLAVLFRTLAQYPEDDVMLIGGGSLYNALYPYCRHAYITWVDASATDADTFIPDFNTLPGWTLESEAPAVETGGYTVHFAVYRNENPRRFEDPRGIGRVYEFLKSAHTYYLATVDGDQPRVRPFGTVLLLDDKLYIQTGRVKPVSHQLAANPKAEICSFADGQWLRVCGELIEDPRVTSRRAMLNAYPELRGMYDEEDGNTQVFYFRNATATFCSFTAQPEIIPL